jgi:hypothetical protein
MILDDIKGLRKKNCTIKMTPKKLNFKRAMMAANRAKLMASKKRALAAKTKPELDFKQATLIANKPRVKPKPQKQSPLPMRPTLADVKSMFIPLTPMAERRLLHENARKNVAFHDLVREHQHRVNLRGERDRLHAVLHHNVHPAMLVSVRDAMNRITRRLND